MKIYRVARSVAAAAAVLGISAGCDLPDNMQVRSGIDPRFVDDDVRFRTSYYFTVLNVCYDKDGTVIERPGFPEIDAVYRYRMTGKADSLFNTVRFEAGTLPANVIDPFGAKIPNGGGGGANRVSDSDVAPAPDAVPVASIRSEVLSASGSETADPKESLGKTIKDAVEKLQLVQNHWEALSALPKDAGRRIYFDTQKAIVATKEMATEIAGAFGDSKTIAKDAKALVEAIDAVKDKIEKAVPQDTGIFDHTVSGADAIIAEAAGDVSKMILLGQSISLRAALWDADTQRKSREALEAKTKKLEGTITSLTCPKGSTEGQGFFVLGPEGWKQFDQNERLLMVMSSSAEPLIGTLEKVAAITRQATIGGSDRLLPFLREESRALESVIVMKDASASDPTAFETSFTEAIMNIDAVGESEDIANSIVPASASGVPTVPLVTGNTAPQYIDPRGVGN